MHLVTLIPHPSPEHSDIAIPPFPFRLHTQWHCYHYWTHWYNTSLLHLATRYQPFCWSVWLYNLSALVTMTTSLRLVITSTLGLWKDCVATNKISLLQECIEFLWACNSIYYQYYGQNSNMVSSINMYIIGYIILTCNKDVQNGPAFYHTVWQNQG